MAEFIIDMPDDYPINEWNVYYPDERDDPMPIGDAVVRCRDCKRFSLDNSDHDYRSGWWCHRWNTDMVKPDGFCAWGERK